MASSSGNTEIALQIFFGIFSIIGIIVTLAGIHYRDSLAGVLLGDRRNRSPSTYEGLPSRGITPSGTSEVDIELGPTLPPSQVDQAQVNLAARNQANINTGQGQEPRTPGISRSPTDSLTMPRAAYDRSHSPSLCRPVAI
ncbi:hypothetical protein B5807_11677 [Epicoccum nigrum]|uniref:Uncharacterized protein n=1 Tax=Epicoccum nigrum TaxID=105696 RepID=A0A1Y2LIL4_EPING|nr:hypothetical protein B5807_11677 [Epicoccum nigrum]